MCERERERERRRVRKEKPGRQTERQTERERERERDRDRETETETEAETRETRQRARDKRGVWQVYGIDEPSSRALGRRRLHAGRAEAGGERRTRNTLTREDRRRKKEKSFITRRKDEGIFIFLTPKKEPFDTHQF